MLEARRHHTKLRLVNLGVLGANPSVSELRVSWKGSVHAPDAKMQVKQLATRELRCSDIPEQLHESIRSIAKCSRRPLPLEERGPARVRTTVLED